MHETGIPMSANLLWRRYHRISRLQGLDAERIDVRSHLRRPSSTTLSQKLRERPMQRLLRFNRSYRLRTFTHLSQPRTRLLATMSGPAETDTQAAAAANTSGITPDSISATLKEKLDASHVDINDISGTAFPLYPSLAVRLALNH